MPCSTQRPLCCHARPHGEAEVALGRVLRARATVAHGAHLNPSWLEPTQVVLNMDTKVAKSLTHRRVARARGVRAVARHLEEGGGGGLSRAQRVPSLAHTREVIEGAETTHRDGGRAQQRERGRRGRHHRHLVLHGKGSQQGLNRVSIGSLQSIGSIHLSPAWPWSRTARARSTALRLPRTGTPPSRRRKG
jgi:hypothetical protein